jgi:beta-lactamase class A
MNKKLLSKIFFTLFLILAGFAVGYFVKYKSIAGLDKLKEEDGIFDPYVKYQLREGGYYKFINPLLECEVAKGTIDSKKQNFEKELGSLVEKEIAEGKLSKMSVYFRDLNNGPTFGVNEDEPFLPASLLKVPVMMAYFVYAENDPAILNKEILFEKKIELAPGAQFIKPSQEIQVGNIYTVEQLIEATIKYSDNQAVFLLYDNLPGQQFFELYQLLGVDDSVLKESEGTLSVKQYSRFLRILFNASFLNRYYSEKALKLLSETEYENALVAGLPKGIVVAHKFGESGFQERERQLHDCGIIYYPNHPYLLCLMSRGKELSGLESSISDVSRFVYQKIAEQY